MKNILLTGGLLLCTSIAVFADGPSYQTKEQFYVDFPNATNVVWHNEEASFTYEGKNLRAYYDIDDQLIGTVTDASYADLPATAKKQIEKHYKGYTPGKVLLFDDNEYNDTDMILYGSPFDDEDNYFVEMQNGNKDLILQVNMRGDVSFFKKL